MAQFEAQEIEFEFYEDNHEIICREKNRIMEKFKYAKFEPSIPLETNGQFDGHILGEPQNTSYNS